MCVGSANIDFSIADSAYTTADNVNFPDLYNLTFWMQSCCKSALDIAMNYGSVVF